MEKNAISIQSFDSGREILKLVALVTMTIDHLGAAIFPNYIFLRIIGRLSFPLYCYLLVLGAESTRNAKNYVIRLLTFAFISQIPFSLALDHGLFETFNIYFTLSLGLVSLLKPILVLPILVIAELANFDYGAYGIAMIACMYILKKNTRNGIIVLLLLNILFLLQYMTQIFSLLALPLILLYKGGYLKVGRNEKTTSYPLWRKYFFYIYYPLHLSVIYLVKVLA